MKAILFAVVFISVGATFATIANITPGLAYTGHCETVYLTGTLKLSRNAVTVESVVCKKHGNWQLPFEMNY